MNDSSWWIFFTYPKTLFQLPYHGIPFLFFSFFPSFCIDCKQPVLDKMKKQPYSIVQTK